MEHKHNETVKFTEKTKVNKWKKFEGNTDILLRFLCALHNTIANYINFKDKQ